MHFLRYKVLYQNATSVESRGLDESNDKKPIQSNTTSFPRHQTGEEHKSQGRYHKFNTIKVESQVDSCFPADGHQATPSKTNRKSRRDRKVDKQ